MIQCLIYRTEPGNTFAWITLTKHACKNFFKILQGSSDFSKTQHVLYFLNAWGLAKDHTFSGFFSFGTLPYLELKTTFLFIGLCLPTVNTSPTPSYFVHKDCSSKTICKFHIDINNSGIITYVSVPIFYSCTEAMHYAAIPM